MPNIIIDENSSGLLRLHGSAKKFVHLTFPFTRSETFVHLTFPFTWELPESIRKAAFRIPTAEIAVHRSTDSNIKTTFLLFIKVLKNTKCISHSLKTTRNPERVWKRYIVMKLHEGSRNSWNLNFNSFRRYAKRLLHLKRSTIGDDDIFDWRVLFSSFQFLDFRYHVLFKIKIEERLCCSNTCSTSYAFCKWYT